MAADIAQTMLPRPRSASEGRRAQRSAYSPACASRTRSATIWAVGTVLPEAPRLLLATLVLLPGLSLILHFGVFNILAGLWRFAGVACGPLFRAPLRSTSR